MKFIRQIALAVALLTICRTAAATEGGDGSWSAADYSRRSIYHSPQHPGYTCWTSAWLAPDKSMWVCFTQATGPLTGRPKTPPDIRKKLSWPPGGIEAYDMNGLKLENVYLRSTDRGETWAQMSADEFRSPINAMGGKGTVALPDGTVIREVEGNYLPYDDRTPPTGCVQLSTDDAKSWSAPIVLLDVDEYFTWPVRIRCLKDGRVLAIGGLVPVPADNDLTRIELSERLQPFMAISSDGGRTWQGPLDVLTQDALAQWKGTEEWDLAELPNGDLLCVFRRDDPNAENVRWQTVLTKDGDLWKAGEPMPTTLSPGGHPELLQTDEGPVVYFTQGRQQAWTADAGKTWHPLEVEVGYYPRSVQAPDGTIYVFSHVGADNPYGEVDQSILMDSFRLEASPN